MDISSDIIYYDIDLMPVTHSIHQNINVCSQIDTPGHRFLRFTPCGSVSSPPAGSITTNKIYFRYRFKPSGAKLMTAPSPRKIKISAEIFPPKFESFYQRGATSGISHRNESELQESRAASKCRTPYFNGPEPQRRIQPFGKTNPGDESAPVEQPKSQCEGFRRVAPSRQLHMKLKTNPTRRNRDILTANVASLFQYRNRLGQNFEISTLNSKERAPQFAAPSNAIY